MKKFLLDSVSMTRWYDFEGRNGVIFLLVLPEPNTEMMVQTWWSRG